MTAQLEITPGDGVTVILGPSRVHVLGRRDGAMEIFIGDADGKLNEKRLVVVGGRPKGGLEDAFE